MTSSVEMFSASASIREQDAVAQDIVGQILDVPWSDEGTMVHEGIGAGRQSQVDGSAGDAPRG